MLSGKLVNVAASLERNPDPRCVAEAVRVLRAIAEEQAEREAEPVPVWLRLSPRPGIARGRRLEPGRPT